MDVEEKLKILADAAKYDVSCSSSGSKRTNTPTGTGNASFAGICHSWSADGRCISLLKVLLSNHCLYDCHYCYNRKSNDHQRAIFTAQELVDLTINFYRLNKFVFKSENRIYLRQKLNIAANHFVVLSVGQIQPRKGIIKKTQLYHLVFYLFCAKNLLGVIIGMKIRV